MGMFGRLLAVVALALAVVVCLGGCRQMGEFAGGMRAAGGARTAGTEEPAAATAGPNLQSLRPAVVATKLAAPPATRREHPSGSAIPKGVTPTPPSEATGGAGQSAMSPHRNPGAEELQRLRRHNGRLVKWTSAEVRDLQIEIAGIPAPVVKSFEFRWGDGKTSSLKRLPARHTYAGAGFYRIDIIIKDILGKKFLDGMVIEVKAPSGGGVGHGPSGP